MPLAGIKIKNKTPLLEISNLVVAFGTGPSRGTVPSRGAAGPRIVDNVSFQIPEGGIFGLAGESGSGKSLTALSIMGILPNGAAAEGSIKFRGEEILNLPSEKMRSIRGREISMVFQEPMTCLNPVLKIGYQVKEALLAHLPISKREAHERAQGLLRAVMIPSPEARMNDYPHQLSGGMRQRVMIAMAIACNPSLLIADEPTTALDVTIEAQILDLINTLRTGRNMSVLLITHDLGVIGRHAATVGVMYAGRLLELSPAGEIFGSPRHPYTIGLMESMPFRGKRGAPLKPIPGSVPPPWGLPPGCKFSDRCAFQTPACRQAEPELREVSPGHFARCIRAEEMCLRWSP
ncbi:MAG: ABC transporter ATP-binding protein [Nitrospiraceae bacterium]|nr:ABC transporter ATP-binding protein [Nitrospiraceae bacterium]